MERALISYLLGALLGAAALVLETFVLGAPIRPSSLAAYTVCGGVLAAGTRGLAEMWIPGYGARGACLAALSAFSALHLAYFVNVKVLPSEPYWTPLSLSLDLVVVGLVLGLGLAAMRSTGAQALRVRYGHVAAAGGLAISALGILGVTLAWPTVAEPGPRAHGRNAGPNLLLIVMDSARRDRFGVYGHGRPTSPALDRWADRSRVFAEALAASSWTVPSVEELLQAGRPGLDPLARRLAGLGYATACFTDNPHLYDRSPILLGFDRVDRSVGRWRALFRNTVLGETVERLDPGNDSRLVGRARRWLDHQTSPFFLYVHLMDSHTPYRHAPIDGVERGGRHIDFPATGMSLTRDEAEDVVARYEGGIRSTDRAVGELLDALERSGEPWLAIVTSDHGESLGEDGRWFHGQTLAPELLSVPLFVLGTGIESGRLSGVVGHSAVPETLARAAGLEGRQGQVDLRSHDGPGRAQGGLPPNLFYRVDGNFKVVLDSEAGHVFLFNRHLDPEEDRDLAEDDPARAAKLAAGIAIPETFAPVAVDPEHLERVRALGYAHASAGPSGSH